MQGTHNAAEIHRQICEIYRKHAINNSMEMNTTSQ